MQPLTINPAINAKAGRTDTEMRAGIFMLMRLKLLMAYAAPLGHNVQAGDDSQMVLPPQGKLI
jgi:hypothetical protein